MFVYGVKGHYGFSSDAESDGDDDPETMLLVSNNLVVKICVV